MNGVHTNTTYRVVFGDGTAFTSIEVKEETIYRNFIGRLWKTVGVRLLTEYLNGLQAGKKYRFASAVVSNDGIELERKNIFLSDEQIFCSWDDLDTWNENGTFCISKKGDKQFMEAFSYQDQDNIHILKACIRVRCAATQ